MSKSKKTLRETHGIEAVLEARLYKTQSVCKGTFGSQVVGKVEGRSVDKRKSDGRVGGIEIDVHRSRTDVVCMAGTALDEFGERG